MQLPIYIIATQYKQGVSTKSGTPKPYEIHTADVLVSVTDLEGVTTRAVATMRMPKESQRGITGDFIADVQAYVNNTKDLAFSIRRLEPAPAKAVTQKP